MRASVLSPPRACSLHRPCLPPALPLVRSLARSFAPALPLVCSLARSFARARALSEAGMPAKCESAWIIPTSQSIQQSSAGRQLSLTGASVRLAVAVLPRQSDIPATSCCPSARAPCPTVCRSVDAWCVSTTRHAACAGSVCVFITAGPITKLFVCEIFFYFFNVSPLTQSPPFLQK